MNHGGECRVRRENGGSAGGPRDGTQGEHGNLGRHGRVENRRGLGNLREELLLEGQCRGVAAIASAGRGRSAGANANRALLLQYDPVLKGLQRVPDGAVLYRVRVNVDGPGNWRGVVRRGRAPLPLDFAGSREGHGRSGIGDAGPFRHELRVGLDQLGYRFLLEGIGFGAEGMILHAGGGTGAHVLGDGVKVELVDVAFPVHLVHDLLVVVVAYGPAQLVVVHAGFPFSDAPEHRDGLRIQELELPAVAGPGNDVGVLLVLEELQ